MKTAKMAAAIAAGVLGLDAMLHLFWATTGSTWPASNVVELSRNLLNVEVSFAPLNLVVIASMPLAAGVLVLARAGLLGPLGRWLPAWILNLGTVALAAAVSLRLLAGIVWIAGVGADPSSTFYRLNLTVYTPLCALLAIASAVVLRSPRPAGRDGRVILIH